MKKLLTKIFVAFMCMVFFCTANVTLPVYAKEGETSKVSKILEMFNAWEITSGIDISEDMVEKLVSPNDISVIFKNINSVPPVFSGDIVRQNDFIEAVVNTLGYKPMVEQYSGYKGMAVELNLFDGVKPATSAAATYEYILRVLDNAMKTQVMLTKYTNSAYPTYTKSENTFLEEVLHIYKSKGVVRANGQYALESRLKLSEEFVMIGTEVYEKNGVNVDTLLGCWTEFYYKDDNSFNLPQLLYAKMYKDGNMIVIDSSDIEDYSNKQYRYYVDNKLKKVNIPADVTVIYNSIPASKYTDEMMKPLSGNVILIDSDGNGSYDVINITSYTYIMVGTIDTYNKKIYDKSNPGINLVYSEDTYFMLPDGTPSAVEELALNSVLSVAYSEDKTTVIITNDTVKGMISGISNDGKSITVNDVTYDISSGFYGDLPKMSANVVLYLDHNADVYYYELSGEDTINYGYVTKVMYFQERGEDCIALKLCKTDGSIGRFYLADKVKIDGVVCKTAEQKRNMLTDENNDTKYQLIIYRVNADDKITYIDTPCNSPDNLNAQPGEKEDENSLRFTFSSYTGDSVKQQVANILTGSKTYYVIGGKTILSGDTIYLSIPYDNEIPDADEEDFGTKAINTIEDDKLCDLEAYTVGDSMISTIAIKREKAVKSIEGGDYAGIVTDVWEKWNEEEGDVVQGIDVLKHGRKYELWAEKGKQFPTGDGREICSIRYGDIIRVNATAYNTGEIKIAEILARIEDGEPVYTDDTVRMESVKDQAIGDFVAESQTIFASVLKREGDVLYIQPEQTMEGQNLDPYYNAISSKSTVVYICETNPSRRGDKITVGSVNDIITHEQSYSDYSKMLIYTAWSNPHMLVIYK